MAGIFVCTPMYGGMCYGDFAVSLLGLKERLAQNFHQFGFMFIKNESLIQRARNSLAWYFMNQTELSHLLFIDGDISFNPDDVLKMLAQDKDIIGGIYPKKGINWDNIKNTMLYSQRTDYENLTGDFVIELEETPEEIFFDKPLEVKHIGTGFMLIKRKVFEDLKEVVGSYISNSYTSDKNNQVYNYFQVTVEKETLLSEDYFFCKSYRDIGGKVFAAPWCNLQHTGTYSFSGSFVEQLKVQHEIVTKLEQTR